MWAGITSMRNALRGGISMSVNNTLGASKSCWASTASAARETGDVALNREEKISIPKKIRRSPTELLEALKSTVRNNQGNPQYKFHDDPYLIPQSNMTKRAYALSRESGRKAAKWVRDQYPPAFETKLAEPHIDRLMPKLKVEKEDATVDSLKRFINIADVTSANTVYDILNSEGKSIDTDIKQAYLELQCFYNGKESTDDELYEEKWFRQSMTKEGRNIWIDSNRAEKLFQELEVKDAKAYSAIICGLSKYFKGDKAFTHYEMMKELKLPVNRTTYNHLIRSAAYVRETSEARWQLVEQLLRTMRDDRIQPDLSTMNAVLEMITKLGSWKDAKKIALQTLSEMKHLGIEPSLASYYFLLLTFCREKGPVSTILYDIMEILKDQELIIRDPKDIHFFVTAMELCHIHVNDYRLAYEVDRVLNHKNNYNLIGDSMKESIYYQNYFKILCSQESVQQFFEVYRKLVPHVYTPEASVMVEIIKMVGYNYAVDYIPSIWSDIVLFDLTSRGNILEELLQVMASNKPKDQVWQQWVDIAWDLKTRVDNEKLKRTIAVQWTGNMLGNLMMICLNCGDYEKACEILKKCDSEYLSISGMPSGDHLNEFGNAAIDKRDGSNGLLCSKYMINIGYLDGIKLAKNILEKVEVTDTIRSSLNEIASMENSKLEQ